MTKLQLLEEEIKTHSRGEIAQLRDWLLEFDAAQRDRQIERDAYSGKLDKVFEKSLAPRRQEPRALKHFASPDFWRLFNQLPSAIQQLAHSNFELLKTNPCHPSLHFKKAAATGRFGSAWRIALSASRSKAAFFGAGSAPTRDTTS